MSLEYKVLGQDSSTDAILGTDFVAISRSNPGVSAYSTNGTTWTQAALPTGYGFRGVAYGDGKFVSLARGSNVAVYSTNGTTWTQTTLPASSGWEAVAYGNGRFAAVAYYSNNVVYSTDGISWSLSTISSSEMWNNVTYGSDKFVAVASGGMYPSAKASYSTDAITWTQATMPNVSGYETWSSTAYGNGKFLVATLSQTALAAYSTDGISWVATTMPQSAQWTVGFGDGKFVALTYDTNSTTAAYSTDAITWTLTNTGVASGFRQWREIAYSGNIFVAIAFNTDLAAYSTDGVVWTAMTMPQSSFWYSVAGEPTTLSPSTQYTVPSTKEAIISSIYIANNSASAQTYSVAVVPNGETLSSIHYIRKDVTIDGNDFQTIPTKITLSAGDQIITEGSSTDVSINVFGVEK